MKTYIEKEGVSIEVDYDITRHTHPDDIMQYGSHEIDINGYFIGGINVTDLMQLIDYFDEAVMDEIKDNSLWP
jgi:hypothetical protein